VTKKRSSFAVPHSERQNRVVFRADPTPEEPAPDEPVLFGGVRGRGELDIVCGACGARVLDGARPEQVTTVFFECPSCERTLKLDLEALGRELS
jgi:hypothetical protein